MCTRSTLLIEKHCHKTNNLCVVFFVAVQNGFVCRNWHSSGLFLTQHNQNWVTEWNEHFSVGFFPLRNGWSFISVTTYSRLPKLQKKHVYGARTVVLLFTFPLLCEYIAYWLATNSVHLKDKFFWLRFSSKNKLTNVCVCISLSHTKISSVYLLNSTYNIIFRFLSI